MKQHAQKVYESHTKFMEQYAKGEGGAELAATWLNTETVDYWRHSRMYACADPLLLTNPGARWLTVGDGHYGRDAWYLSQKGAKVVASDVADVLLREGKAAGLISDYSQENAEKLSFENDSFDFVFCKESFHHFPRPMIALYEMLRVARTGVLLIEPNEAPEIGELSFLLKRVLKKIMLSFGLGSRLRNDDTSLFIPYGNTYEEAGNYVYSISEREIEKVALGLNYPVVAFKGVNDWYLKGVEYETADSKSVLLNKIKTEIRKADRRVQKGLSRGHAIQLVACIFKKTPGDSIRNALTAAGFRIGDLPRNPHITETAE